MIDHLNTRQGTAADIDTIRAFTRQSYAKWVPLIGREPLPMSANYEQTIETNRFDLFYQDQELAALLETINNEDHLLIENVCVAPFLQRMGIGKSLLDYAEELAKDACYDMIRLNTNKFFEGNVDLYLRHGYAIDWEKPVVGGIHVHMKKSIA